MRWIAQRYRDPIRRNRADEYDQEILAHNNDACTNHAGASCTFAGTFANTVFVTGRPERTCASGAASAVEEALSTLDQRPSHLSEAGRRQ